MRLERRYSAPWSGLRHNPLFQPVTTLTHLVPIRPPGYIGTALATAQANKGQAIILSRARVQGSIDTIDDDFLSDTNGLDTANIWTIEAGGGQSQSVFILPPDASQGFWVNWASANSTGFALQTNSVLGNTNSFPWSTNGLPDPQQLGLLKRTLLPSNSLPGGAQGFFLLSKPGF